MIGLRQGIYWRFQMKTRIIVLLLGVFFRAQLGVASPVIKWAPANVTRLLFPGQTLRLHISFQSNQTLSNVRMVVVPSLQSIVNVSPQSFSTVAAGNQYTLEVDVVVPSTHPT